MPCYDPRDAIQKEDYREGAELLCRHLTELEELGHHIPVVFRQWWISHKEIDRKHFGGKP